MHALVLAAALLNCDGGSFWLPDDIAKLERVQDSRPLKDAKPVVFDDGAFLIRKGARRWKIHAMSYPGSDAEDVSIREHRGLWLLSYKYREKFGDVRITILLDAEKPRIVRVVGCEYGRGGGACSGPDSHLFPSSTLQCDEDFRCTSTQTMTLDWTNRTATRTFDLLTNKTIPARDATYRVTKNITAKHARGSALTLRFFAGSREIPVKRLTDGGYDGKDYYDMDDEYSTAGPPLKIRTKSLGKGNYEVLVQEGEGRAIFRVNTKEAIRIASDGLEYRGCNRFLQPPTVYAADRYGNRHFLLSEGGDLVPRCDAVGKIAWSAKDGWTARYAQVPCTTPTEWPWKLAIDGQGNISIRRYNFHDP